MTFRDRIYARSVVRRLQEEIRACPDNVTVMSPYLTSGTAELVIDAANPGTSRVYTTFSARNFAIGASSITTLRKLIDRGHRLLHIKGLHAKVVLTERIASVGSQNLTLRGTRNREASVILDDPVDVAHLRAQIVPWIRAAEPVTAEMIGDLEKLLPDLRSRYVKLGKLADRTDRAVWQAQVDRDEVARIEAEQERHRQRRNQERLRRETSSPEVARSDAISGRIQTLHHTYDTLKCTGPGPSFLRWWMSNGRWRRLTKTNRYLVLNSDSTALAWVAMFKVQLSKFAVGVQLDKPLLIRGHYFALDIQFATEPGDLAEWNVRFDLVPWHWPTLPRPHSTASSFFCRFLGLRLELIRAVYESDDLKDFFESVDPGSETLQHELRARLLSPFKYEHNRLGESPIRFLHGDTGARFQLRLHEFEAADSADLTYLTIQRG
jgi:hypothetical protein